MPLCKHEIESNYCGICREYILESAISLKPFLLKSNNLIGLILDTPAEKGTIEVFLAAEKGEIARIKEEEIAEMALTEESRTKLLKTAEETAWIWLPKGPLTSRENSEEGPSHCWNCKKTLSYTKGSLGCLVCGQYACICGSCICDFPGGRNYLWQFIPPGQGLPCDKVERQQYIRIIKALRHRGSF